MFLTSEIDAVDAIRFEIIRTTIFFENNVGYLAGIKKEISVCASCAGLYGGGLDTIFNDSPCSRRARMTPLVPFNAQFNFTSMCNQFRGE